ncbi:hypothetical protein T08_9846 [Trichinella sp. T8]|nr:hypothetical protein T08_9846 [Trichinella sp. T8]
MTHCGRFAQDSSYSKCNVSAIFFQLDCFSSSSARTVVDERVLGTTCKILESNTEYNYPLKNNSIAINRFLLSWSLAFDNDVFTVVHGLDRGKTSLLFKMVAVRPNGRWTRR